jgi:hypothetical protein
MPTKEEQTTKEPTREEQLIQTADIATFLQTHQGAAAAVKRAAALLADKPDALASLRKLLPALDAKAVKVFFSYKSTDKVAAEAIVQVLSKTSAGKLEITFQGGFGKIVGQSYRQKIRDSVREANWFILLLPDPSDELDWCLYETGQFEAQLTSADRLICLHHPDTAIPRQIEGYQAVAATLPDMSKFLDLVYVQPDTLPGLDAINPAIGKEIPDPINPANKTTEIPSLAKSIVDVIRAPKRRLQQDVFVPSIAFQIQQVGTLTSKDALDSATIVSANPEALNLFGYRQPVSTFRDLRKRIVETHGDRWREELFQAVLKIIQGQPLRLSPASVHFPGSAQEDRRNTR